MTQIYPHDSFTGDIVPRASVQAVSLAGPRASLIYQAPYPRSFKHETSSKADIAKKVTSCLLGVGLFYYGAKGLTSHLATRVICQGAYISKKDRAHLDRLRGNIFLVGVGNRASFKTPDGVKLDGIFYPCGNQKDEVILYVGGNATFYECEREVCDNLRRTFRCPVLAFNRRGVGASEGKPSHKLIALDTYAALRYLVAQGYQS